MASNLRKSAADFYYETAKGTSLEPVMTRDASDDHGRLFEICHRFLYGHKGKDTRPKRPQQYQDYDEMLEPLTPLEYVQFTIGFLIFCGALSVAQTITGS